MKNPDRQSKRIVALFGAIQTQSVEFMPGFEENEETIKAFLIEKALEW